MHLYDHIFVNLYAIYLKFVFPENQIFDRSIIRRKKRLRNYFYTYIQYNYDFVLLFLLELAFLKMSMLTKIKTPILFE